LNLKIQSSRFELRGLTFEGQPADFLEECFLTDERVYVELNVGPTWRTQVEGAIAHLVLFVIDSAGINCLCQSAGFRVTYAITQPRDHFPTSPRERLKSDCNSSRPISFHDYHQGAIINWFGSEL